MPNKLKNIFLKTSLIAFFIISVLLPLFCYKLNLNIEILPAIEILLIFHLYCFASLRLDELFILGLLFDQLYNMPIGTNSLAVIAGIIVIKLLSKWLLIKDYISNFFILSNFCLIIFFVRFIVNYSKNLSCASPIIFMLYYLATVFSYPIFKILFDKTSYYLKTSHAK